MNLKNKIIFIDYEGTLSENPSGKGELGEVTLKELLFDNNFLECKPIKKTQKLLTPLDPKKIYVVGVIDTNFEINQKYKWLKTHYPFILKKNIVFISCNNKKVEVLNNFLLNNNWKKEDVVFIDDKESHLKFARDEGYDCYNIKDL